MRDMLFGQRSPVHQEAWSPGGDNDIQQTAMATYRLNWPKGRFSEKPPKYGYYPEGWLGPRASPKRTLIMIPYL